MKRYGRPELAVADQFPYYQAARKLLGAEICSKLAVAQQSRQMFTPAVPTTSRSGASLPADAKSGDIRRSPVFRLQRPQTRTQPHTPEHSQMEPPCRPCCGARAIDRCHWNSRNPIETVRQSCERGCMRSYDLWRRTIGNSDPGRRVSRQSGSTTWPGFSAGSKPLPSVAKTLTASVNPNLSPGQIRGPIANGM